MTLAMGGDWTVGATPGGRALHRSAPLPPVEYVLEQVASTARAVAVERALPGARDRAADLDAFARLAATVARTEFGLVSLIGPDCQSYVGRSDTALPPELDVDSALVQCTHVVATRRPLVVPDVLADRRFATHPAAVSGLLRYYVGAPIVDEDGEVVGAVCAIDSVSRDGASSAEVAALEDIAAQVSALLSLARRQAEQAAQRRVLAAVAAGSPLADSLDLLAREVSQLVGGGVTCSVMLADADGRSLRVGAAPALTPELVRKLDGLPVGPGNGACGEAAHAGKPVVIRDAVDYPNDFVRELLAEAGVRAVASMPVLHSDERTVLGAFALYRLEPGVPSRYEWDVLRSFGDLTRLVIEQSRGHDRLTELATRDTVTGLLNRSAFLAEAAAALRTPPAGDREHVLLFCDVDHFKLINDTRGHAAGDAYLRAAATALGERLRPGDLACRYAGDAFTILALDVPAGSVQALAERAVSAFAVPVSVAGHALRLSASVGAAVSSVTGRDVEALLSDADLAMHQAKAAGRSRARVCDATLRARAQEDNELALALRDAIASDGLDVAYQPEIDLETGQLVGLEALARWNRPGHGPVSPAVFIPLAEESGLIEMLGRSVLTRALLDLAEWRERHAAARGLTVWVNVSAGQLEGPQFAREVDRLLQQTRLPAACLGLEVTESVVMGDASATRATLEALRERGVRVAIDDFGTGYSSLGALRELPVDVLKIDRSFVTGLGTEQSDYQLVTAILAMAGALGLAVVAEGIETEAQLHALEELGCGTGQGFLLGRPQPVADVEALLGRARALVG
ncbi:putative bifunctional diguanylate cyclase/phosphodiesterase [Motilibacter deserti]|uniref:EAL domain-containing protein n=1 Tax=Motilibacter deserti TaxID=2714956 RepID=A0ABX0GXI3_9ACTN|nr:EAL domain-containing protein [Motilibacter deserti]NHC15278.1 EAL domain-containing protein [Motilibacter deserti]